MKDFILSFFSAVIIVLVLTIGLDWCLHHNDYKVSSRELIILGNNLVGDTKCVTSDGDTVIVDGEYYSPILYRASNGWQVKSHLLDVVGFTADSVMVHK